VSKAAVRRTGDEDPSVRAAAVEALALSRYPLAAPALHRLLRDDVFFVRAHAARALATCAPESCGPELVPLLADANWWVRSAAKESLVALGDTARDAVVGALRHQDRFARDGAAEIVLNSALAGTLLAASRAGDASAAAAVELLARRSPALLEVASAERAPDGSQPPSAAVAG
jgi:HEAT repeat protein